VESRLSAHPGKAISTCLDLENLSVGIAQCGNLTWCGAAGTLFAEFRTTLQEASVWKAHGRSGKRSSSLDRCDFRNVRPSTDDAFSEASSRLR